MKSDIGWILDIGIEQDHAVIWLRTADNHVLRLKDLYSPSFYIRPKQETELEHLDYVLTSSPHITRVTQLEKFISLDRQAARLLHVELARASRSRGLVRSVEAIPQVAETYNVDLLHEQQYVFHRPEIAPTSKVEIEHDSDGWLRSVKRLDDDHEVRPPPFSTMVFDIHARSPTLTPNPERDPIARIEARTSSAEFVLDGPEQEILEDFSSLVRETNPDFLVCPECDDFTMPYLYERARSLGIDLELGRERTEWKTFGRAKRPRQFFLNGRVTANYSYLGYSFEDWGLAGLVERSRFSLLPPRIAARWLSNRVIDSRNCYELIKRGYVIPKNLGGYVYVRPLSEVVNRDRGGLIIAPRIGFVHENVAELDFDSEFPNIIIKKNISYETVTPEGITPKEDAILPITTKPFLDRRLFFKKLRKQLSPDTQEWLWCNQRVEALKLILVCIYGTSGCCWNRFGNVVAFEEINSISREVLLRAKEIAQSSGYEVVYADTDSIFVKKPDATKEDYESLVAKIREETGMSISLDHHYKFVVFLSLESDPSGIMEAQKRYYGALTDGELLARGIELRRHDTPSFIKNFQENLIQILFNCKSAEEVATDGYKRALAYLWYTLDRLMTGKIPLDQLVVSKILRRPLNSYKHMTAHVSAAVILANHGRQVKEGDNIQFLYVNNDHHNPLCRVIPTETNLASRYDLDKYRDLLLDAAETILGTFGFRQENIGLLKPMKTWKQELQRDCYEEELLELETEMMGG